MHRRLSRIALKLVIVWLVLATSLAGGCLEAFGDCALERQTPTAVTGLCVHGDTLRHEHSSEPCPSDHHTEAQCHCSCHTTAILCGITPISALDLLRLLAPASVVKTPERRDPPVLLPPIAG